MSNSSYIYDNGLGCGCGCSKPASGLGESAIENKTEAPVTATKKDLLETAKTYINHEIPLPYKAGAMALGVGYLWWKTRKKK